jgi:hypothetical protein
MAENIWRSIGFAAAFAGITAIAPASISSAQEKSAPAIRGEWLNKYHESSSSYVIFPNGQIFAARAKMFGIMIGRLNLWHCFHYMPLQYIGDENIYLTARVVEFLDDDAKDIPARYRTQCALKSYPGDPYERIVR